MFISTSDVVQEHSAGKCQSSNQQNVVGRSARARLELAKKLLGQHTIASHAEEKAGSAESAGEAAAESSHDEDESHRIEQDRATHTAADIHVSGLKIRER